MRGDKAVQTPGLDLVTHVAREGGRSPLPTTQPAKPERQRSDSTVTCVELGESAVARPPPLQCTRSVRSCCHAPRVAPGFTPSLRCPPAARRDLSVRRPRVQPRVERTNRHHGSVSQRSAVSPAVFSDVSSAVLTSPAALRNAANERNTRNGTAFACPGLSASGVD